MKKTLLYTRSILEIIVGIFFALGALSGAIKAIGSIIGTILYWSVDHLAFALGDTLGVVLLGFLGYWLLKDGRKVWGRTRA